MFRFVVFLLESVDVYDINAHETPVLTTILIKMRPACFANLYVYVMACVPNTTLECVKVAFRIR